VGAGGGVLLVAAGVDGRQVEGGAGGGADQDGCAGGVSSFSGAVRPDSELVWPGAGVCVTGAEATVSHTDGADVGADGAAACEAAPVADAAVPANEAGERQDGFVSAADRVAALAGADCVLAFDRVSGSDDAELAKPGLADPKLADPKLADSGPADPELADSGPADPELAGPALADIVLPDATTGSGAEAPSGLAGMSGWPLPLERDSSGGGIAALGTVASERLPRCATVTGDESPLC
jgi:hypothetical protein